MRRSQSFDALGRVRAARDFHLDFDNLLARDFEPQRDQRGRGLRRIRVLLVHGSKQHDLARLDVAHEEPIRPLRFHAAPKAIADRKTLAVLRVAHVARERRRARIVLDQRIEVAVDEALETAAVACGVALCFGRSAHQQA